MQELTRLKIGFLGIMILLYLANISAFPTSDTITSTIDEEKDPIFDNIKKINEISPNVLSKGYTSSYSNNEAFRILIGDKKYFLILEKITSENIDYYLFNNEKSSLKLNETKIIDLNKDGKLDIVINYINFDNDKAIIYLKEYSENFNGETNYKELFDIEVGLSEEKIVESKDLTIYIRFVNFGEGPSRINIVYSIINSSGSEVYTGVDDKVVYTEDSIIKNFDFLRLEPGEYKITSSIYYGKNQTAISEKSFEIIGKSSYSGLISIVLFVFFVILFYFLINFFTKKNEKNDSK
ncbi:MAG: hypothetical protein WC867_06250 [Candidatus Pacearchaeota archaeon]|jgi:hypothetical protein